MWCVPDSLMFLSAAPYAPPQNVSGEIESSRTITLEWEPPPLELQNGIITSYEIEVTELETAANFLFSTSDISFLLGSLHPAYTYDIVIAATTSAGTGPYSLPETFTMFEDGKSCTVTYLSKLCLYSFHLHVQFPTSLHQTLLLWRCHLVPLI